MNRYRKRGKDAGEWIPDQKRYWFAVRVVEAKRACGLTVDRREAAILDSIPSSGGTTEMEPVVCRAAPASAKEARRTDGGRDDVLARFDDNGNGRITCKEARRRGIAPVNRTHPAYRYMRAGDGVVCEWTCRITSYWLSVRWLSRPPSRYSIAQCTKGGLSCEPCPAP